MEHIGTNKVKIKIFLTVLPFYQTVWCHIPDVSHFEIWCFDILQHALQWKQNRIFATGFTVSTIRCLTTVSRHQKNKCCGSCQRLASQAGSGCHSGHAPPWKTDHTTWRKQRRTLTSVSQWIVTETSLGRKIFLKILCLIFMQFCADRFIWLRNGILFWEKSINYLCLKTRY